MKPVSPVWLKGKVSRQAHRDLPEGTYEREVGRAGFGGPASHLYHQHPPTGWSSFEGPLRPRAFDLNSVAAEASPFDARPILANETTMISYWVCSQSMPQLVRDADGDLLMFFHAGSCDFFCDYGHMNVSKGDYLLIPRGTMWRINVTSDIQVLIIETSRLDLPDRGLLGQHALFDPAKLDVPEINEQFQAQQEGKPWQVEIKKRRRKSRVNYPFNPLDAIGWKGTLAPIRLNISDILPVSSHRYHLPPSVHSTFENDELIVSTFAPRPFETDPSAIKVPFFHSNDDIDEIIFYHDGDFFSRDHIRTGMLSFHPAGFTHGPHPKALQNMFDQTKSHTDEYAVMIDAKTPLELVTNTTTCKDESPTRSENEAEQSQDHQLADLELSDYALSWKN